MLNSVKSIRNNSHLVYGCWKRYNSSSNKSNRDLNYCVDLVKSNDEETYLSTLVLPKELLHPAFVIKAFNIELLSIGRSRQEPRISEIKLQFWKDQIDRIYGKNENQASPAYEGSLANLQRYNEPVTKQLSVIINKYNINKIWLNRLIEGRKFFLTSQFKTVEDLEKCADLSNSYYTMFNCMNLKNVDCDHAANHVAKAQLICAVVKNLFKKSTQSVHYLPVELIAKHKIAQQDLINFSERVIRAKQSNFKELSFELCSRAKEHLDCARKLKNKMPKDARRVLISAVSSDIFLANVQKYDFDMLNPKMNSDFKTTFLIKLFLAKYSNSF